MIRRAVKNDDNRILTYIGDHYADCLYLYLNYRKYGCGSEAVTTYVSEDTNENINGVILKYHDCLHIYSKMADMASDECESFIDKEAPEVIFVNSIYNDRLQDHLKKERTMHEMKAVEKYCRDEYMIEGVYLASVEELPEIAEFLMTDSVYNTVYASAEELSAQMTERVKDGYGCTYVARENNKITWTSSVVAQDDHICLESLIMLAPYLRKKGLGKPAVATLANILARGGKQVFAFPVEATLGINDSLGYKRISNTIKWIRKGGSG